MKKIPDEIKNIIINYLLKLSQEYSKINILRKGAIFNISKLSAPHIYKLCKPLFSKKNKSFDKFKIKNKTIQCYTENNNFVIYIL